MRIRTRGSPSGPGGCSEAGYRSLTLQPLTLRLWVRLVCQLSGPLALNSEPIIVRIIQNSHIVGLNHFEAAYRAQCRDGLGDDL